MNLLHDRKTSGFPLSIGTGLAFESVFNRTQAAYDPDRKIPQKIEISDYETVWINLTTLIRNLQAAVGRDTYLLANPQDILTILLEEMDVINNLVAENGNEVRVRYYYSDYSEVERKIKLQSVKLMAMRDVKTREQKVGKSIQENILAALLKQSDDIFKFTGALEPDRRDKSLVLTHQPYDLTAYKQFNELHLLESNTGLVKPRNLWSSKYYPLPGVSTGADGMGRLPFFRKLLMVFGDKPLIVPTLLAFRKKIYQTAVNRHWSAATTMDKVNLDLSLDFKDPAEVAAWRVY